jgi:hypothetical protein
MLFLFSVLGLFFWFHTTQAILVNVTIDDTVGDSLTGVQVTYTPTDAWDSTGNLCKGCKAPDPQNLDHGTSHDSTVRASI